MCSSKYYKNLSERGFSLIELVIAIVILGLVLLIAMMSFSQWLTKSRVEAQVKQMVSDISELRIRALTTKQRYSVTLDANSYTFKSYTTENQSKSNGNNIPGGTYIVKYGLKHSTGTAFSGISAEIFEIYPNGMLANIGDTVFIDYAGSAAIDCFTMNTVRVNPGKASGATCNDR
jgi:prepilin-type N-terminal cleavage/methylation domain-containing protein